MTKRTIKNGSIKSKASLFDSSIDAESSSNSIRSLAVFTIINRNFEVREPSGAGIRSGYIACRGTPVGSISLERSLFKAAGDHGAGLDSVYAS
jgi:hypothetical protein